MKGSESIPVHQKHWEELQNATWMLFNGET